MLYVIVMLLENYYIFLGQSEPVHLGSSLLICLYWTSKWGCISFNLESGDVLFLHPCFRVL